MKEKKIYIETSKGTIPLVFNLNVMEEIQEEYGSLDKWVELTENKNGIEPNVKSLKQGFFFMINEGIEIDNEDKDENRPLFTLKQVGRLISEIGVDEVAKKIQEATINSTKVDEVPKNE